MRLHRDVRIQVIESTIGLFASVPAALVHALDFFVSSTRSLVLLRAWDRDKRVYSGERMASLRCLLVQFFAGILLSLIRDQVHEACV